MHILILVIVLIALFGAKKLPDAAKGIGHSMRIFKAEAKAMKDEGKDAYEGKDHANDEQGRQLADTSAAQQLEAPAAPQQQPQNYQPQPQYQPQNYQPQPQYQYQQVPSGPGQHAAPQSVSGSLGSYPPGGYENPADQGHPGNHSAPHVQG
jgi:sec-independent protein translocase protein TatA